MSLYDLDRQLRFLRFTNLPWLKRISLWQAPTRLLSNNLLLIFGAQRSGTTLMFMLLTAHPRITGLDESHARPIYQSTDLLPPWPVIAANSFLRQRTVFKLPVSSARMQDIISVYKGCHIIWMIRHPFSVIASMRNLTFPDGQSWLEKFALSQAKSTLAITSPDAICELDVLDHISHGAALWKHRLLLMEQYQQGNVHVYPIRYEELVTESEAVLRPLLAQLSLSWSDQLLEHHRLHQGAKYAGFADGSRPLDKDGLNRGRELTDIEQQKVRDIAGDVMVRYSYH